jgi:alkylhydroperoxidase/carboxymuconolactone decarboxylase family protein YurZ
VDPARGNTWKVQPRAALKNQELMPEQARETLIQLVQYVGYPRASSLLGATEEAIRGTQK